jgi:hypothetical protein
MDSASPNLDPSKIPLALNPNGDPPNFIDPPTLAPAVLGAGVTLIIISGIVVLLRLIANFKNTRKFGLDDCLPFPIISAGFHSTPTLEII